MKRAFPLEDILTVLHTKHFSQGEEGVSELVSFLVGVPPSAMPPNSQFLRSGVMDVSVYLRNQLKYLTEATQPPEFESEAALWEWVETMKERHGATIQVEPIN